MKDFKVSTTITKHLQTIQGRVEDVVAECVNDVEDHREMVAKLTDLVKDLLLEERANIEHLAESIAADFGGDEPRCASGAVKVALAVAEGTRSRWHGNNGPNSDEVRMQDALVNIICLCAPDPLTGKYDEYPRMTWNIEQNARHGVNPRHGWIPYPGDAKLVVDVPQSTTCQDRQYLEEDEDFASGPVCGLPATHTNCDWLGKVVCATHKCRCSKKLVVAEKPVPDGE